MTTLRRRHRIVDRKLADYFRQARDFIDAEVFRCGGGGYFYSIHKH